MEDYVFPEWTLPAATSTPPEDLSDAYEEWKHQFMQGEEVPSGGDYAGYPAAFLEEMTTRCVLGQHPREAAEALLCYHDRLSLNATYVIGSLRVAGEVKLLWDWLRGLVASCHNIGWNFNPLHLKSLTGDWDLEGLDVALLTDDSPCWGTTKNWGRPRFDEILDRVPEVLEDGDHGTAGPHPQRILEDFTLSDLTKGDMKHLLPSVDTWTRNQLWSDYQQEVKDAAPADDGRALIRPHLLSRGLGPSVRVETLFVPAVAELASKRWALAVMEEAENRLREDLGYHRKHTHHVAETALVEHLRHAFPDEVVLQEARPPWLSPLRLDVYFPHHMVAVERDGAHHHEAPELWGGEAATRDQKKRDRKKDRQCADVGCTLIRVTPDEDLDAVVERVQQALSGGPETP